MDRDRCRPFGLFDVMILVGFISVGLASPRIVFPLMQRSYFSDLIREVMNPDSRYRFVAVLELWAMFGAPLVASLAAAVVAIRLRRPRPPLRQALRSPGVLACGWIALGMLLTLVCLLGVATLLGPLLVTTFNISADLHENASAALLVGQPVSAFAILASWGTSALYRRPRPVRPCCWIDRLGLVVAVIWLLSVPLHVLFLMAFS